MTGRGFTLLEVMIAVAILGLSLTAIFSSEVGAANVAARARRQNVAATLARCKMGEIEQVIAIEGLPALEKKDTDACCEHAPVEGFECDWLVERIILPELGATGDEEGDEDAELTSAVSGSLRLADQLELTSIALPAISTGIFGFPKDRAAGLIFTAILNYFEINISSDLNLVSVILNDQPTVSAFLKVWNSIGIEKSV